MELTEKQIAEILHADVKRFKKLSTKVPNCDQYLDPASQIIFTRIKDGRMEPGKILRITKGADNEDYYFLLFLCALTGKDGKNKYFFELTNEPLEDDDEEKKPFLGFGNGVLKLSSELDNYEIAPVQTGHKVVKYRTEDDDVVEHYLAQLQISVAITFCYPKIIVVLYMKNGRSCTPRSCALKPFNFEFRDSA